VHSATNDSQLVIHFIALIASAKDEGCYEGSSDRCRIVVGSLAVFGFIVATNKLMHGPVDPEHADRSLRYIVGTYLIPVILLIVSLILRERIEKPPGAKVK